MLHVFFYIYTYTHNIEKQNKNKLKKHQKTTIKSTRVKFTIYKLT